MAKCGARNRLGILQARRPGYGVALAFGLIQALGLAAGPPGGSGGFPFSALAEPPPVQRMVFGERDVGGSNAPAGPFGPLGHERLEGAVQPSGWFLALPPRPGQAAGPYLACGGGSNELWMLSPDRSYLQVQSLEYATATNGPRPGIGPVALAARHRLLASLRLGLPEALPGSLRWDGADAFAYLSPSGPIQGQVGWDARARPAWIRFQGTNPPAAAFQVTCHYGAGEEPAPVRWTLDRLAGTNRSPVSGGSIERLEWGELPPGGLSYARFRGSNAPPILIVESNGVASAMNAAPPKPPAARPAFNPGQAAARYRILLAGGAAILGWLAFTGVLARAFTSRRGAAAKADSPPERRARRGRQPARGGGGRKR